MKTFDITTTVVELQYEELDDDIKKMVDRARQATYRSYAPYSRFCVGAAVYLDNGQIIEGSNQENASYPCGTCAERTAMFYAHSRYPDAALACVVIAARDASGELVENPISPCGGCRQALLEYETLAGKACPVVLCGASKIYMFPSVKSLLPFSFTEF